MVNVDEKIDQIRIYSLAPEAMKTKNGEFDAYCKYLDKAYSDNSICNIAVTGNYGIGKSSFLHTYDKNKRFLFVSICDFLEDKEKEDQKGVEYSLLYQLLLGCEKNLLFHVLPRSTTILQRNAMFIVGLIFGFSVFLLLFSSKIGAYLRILNLYNMALSSWLHLVLYLFLCSVGAFVFGWLFRQFLLEWKLKKVSIKLEHVQVDAEIEEGISYLDCYRSKLIYALTEVAQHIDYTVVFEDMDRLEREVCVPLFTRLRELNRLINIQLNKEKEDGSQDKDNDEIMRFIYVVHDSLFALPSNNQNNPCNNQRVHELMQLKFFDYILPIVPALSRKNAEVELEKCFSAIGFDHDDFIKLVSPYLADYRLIHNIANEYQVFRDIELARNENMSADKQQKIMAFVIYKNLMPEDYKNIRDGNSKVFPFAEKLFGENINDAICPQVVQVLYQSGWLSLDCLLFIGYKESEILDSINKAFIRSNMNTKKIGL